MQRVALLMRLERGLLGVRERTQKQVDAVLEAFAMGLRLTVEPGDPGVESVAFLAESREISPDRFQLVEECGDLCLEVGAALLGFDGGQCELSDVVFKVLSLGAGIGAKPDQLGVEVIAFLANGDQGVFGVGGGLSELGDSFLDSVPIGFRLFPELDQLGTQGVALVPQCFQGLLGPGDGPRQLGGAVLEPLAVELCPFADLGQLGLERLALAGSGRRPSWPRPQLWRIPPNRSSNRRRSGVPCLPDLGQFGLDRIAFLAGGHEGQLGLPGELSEFGDPASKR